MLPLHKSPTAVVVGEHREVEQNAQPLAEVAPQWSEKPPTVPGWYWWGRATITLPVRIADWRGDGELYVVGDSDCFPVSEAAGVWCGPLAPPATAPASPWRDIATAPHGGEVLLLVGDCAHVGKWVADAWRVSCGVGCTGCIELKTPPTHWMELPPSPPATAAGGAGEGGT